MLLSQAGSIVSSLTDSLDTLVQYQVDKFKTAASAGLITDKSGLVVLTPDNVWYGDQNKLPAVPALCIEPSSRPRTLEGVSYRTNNDFQVYFMWYHADVTQSNQNTRQQVQQLSEAGEALIHKDPQCNLDTGGGPGGLLIHCFCQLNESGYTYRSNTLYRTNRVTFSGYSKTALR